MADRAGSAADMASNAVMHEWQRRARDIVDARLPQVGPAACRKFMQLSCNLTFMQILHPRDEHSARFTNRNDHTLGPSSADVSRLSLAVGSAAGSPVPVRPLEAGGPAGRWRAASPTSLHTPVSPPSVLSNDTMEALPPSRRRASSAAQPQAQAQAPGRSQGPGASIPHPARRSSLSPTGQRQPSAQPTEWAVAVAVRARPLNAQELGMGDSSVWRFDAQGSTAIEKCSDGTQPKLHKFTHVFPPRAPTSAVYDEVGVPVVDAALSGHNATIMAYGQTSTGKTHTLMGTPDEPGIVILAVHDLFAAVTQALARGQRQYELRISYLELFNEELKDLFDPTAKHLRIVDDPHVGTTVQNITEEVVRSPDRVLQLLTIGEGNRAVSMTNMNARSSRSHCIFRLTIESWSAQDEREDADDVRSSVLNLVDLAGSERVSKSGATGARMKESAKINTSLLTLGTVINKLTAGADHIPYRDSKLTRLLSSSLGGNARTGIICTVSPAGWNKGETRSTLQFAERAMRIVNRPAPHGPPSSASLLGRYRREIQSLRGALLQARGETDILLDGETLTPAEVIARLQTAHQGKESSLQAQLASLQASEEQSQTAVSSLLELLLAASHGVALLQQAPDIMFMLRDVATGSSSAPRAIRSIYAGVPGLQAAMQADRGDSGRPPMLHLTASTGAPQQAPPLTPEEFARQLLQLREERDALRAERDALRANSADAAQRGDELGDILVEMQEQLTQTRQELAAAHKQVRQKAEQVSAAERQAEHKDGRLQAARDRESVLQQQLRAAEDTLGDTVAELSAAQQAATVRAEQAETQLRTAEEQLHTQRAQSKDYELRLADLRRDLTDSRVRADSLELQLEDRTVQLQRAEEHTGAAEAREGRLQEELLALREDCERRIQAASNQAAADVRTAREEHNATQQQAHATQEELRGLESRLQDTQGRTSQLQAQLGSRDAALCQMEYDMQQQQQRALEQLQAVQEKVDQERAANEALRRELQVEQAERQQLQTALHSTQQQLSTASSQLGAAQERTTMGETASAKAEQALAKAEQDIEQLRALLQAARKQLSALQAEHAMCGGTAQEQAQKVGAAVARAEQAEAKQAQLSMDLQSAEHRLHATQKKLQEQKARMDAVSTERTVFYERMSSAEEQVQLSNKLLLGAHEAVADMEQQVAEAEERVTTIRLAVLRAENQATRSAFSDLEGELQEAKRGVGGGGAGGGRALQSKGRVAAAPVLPVATGTSVAQSGSHSTVTSSRSRLVSFHTAVHSLPAGGAQEMGAAGTAWAQEEAVPPVTPARGGLLDTSQLTPMSALSRGTMGSTPFSLSGSDTPSPQLKFDSSQ